MRTWRGLRPFWLLAVLVCSPTFASETAEATRQALGTELEDFSATTWNHKPVSLPNEGPHFLPAVGPALTRYRERLAVLGEWPATPVWHQAGTIQLAREDRVERLGINVFLPGTKPRGTLLFVHGYLSHAADFAYTFAFFVSRGWSVVTLDLPGHGLSTGPRGDIDQFSEYGDAVQTWLAWCSAQPWEGPVVLLAHSLGTAACLDALSRPGTFVPDRVIFCAPLLRPAWYPALLTGEALLGWAIKGIPAQLGNDGYLDGTQAPTHWFAELHRWLDAWADHESLSFPLVIFSGDRDQIVDQLWNRSAYQRLVPSHRYVLLSGSDHFFLTARSGRLAVHEEIFQVASEALIPRP